ncbi:MAG TPA: Ppx/GppA phosphatase family protein [Solirubrobacteraceae bacterium]|nr:Ppx/GppA phosphatase family protein [Solirubrobacteraceae bacterium]
MSDTGAGGEPRRLAVIDLGSNSFRLVVFSAEPDRGWRRTDEIYESVRIGAGMAASGRLGEAGMERALHTIVTYAHFCRATGLGSDQVRALATSAIREAANRDLFLARAREASGLDVRVLSPQEEARYGYLAAVNSTSLDGGAVLDLGGGSLQLVAVRERRAGALGSWPLGTVRMTERFMAEERTSAKQLRRLRDHVREELGDHGWRESPGNQLVGLGGTVRNLAAAAQRSAGLPTFGVQGFRLTRGAVGALVEELASMPASERGRMPGIKPERGDVILAGAAVIEAVMDIGGHDALEVTEAGLREGAFFEWYLAPADPPLFASVREASVRNLAAQYDSDRPHVEHVAALALQMFDALGEAGVHPADAWERELLWAAAMLHDIGMTVDYDDHHKHSRYLILNAGLPGFSPREVALIAQAARYHRKGSPGLGDLSPLAQDGDDQRLARLAALLRVAEQLERSRDQAVRGADVAVEDSRVTIRLVADADVSVAHWAAERQADIFARAFGRRLAVEERPRAGTGGLE